MRPRTRSCLSSSPSSSSRLTMIETVIQLKPDASATKEELLKFLEGKIAKWWTPDDVAFVEAVPINATGKIQKLALREQFKDYALPAAEA